MNASRLLDPATAAVDRAIEAARYDRLDPADLSTVIAAMRELFWHTTTLTNALNRVYDSLADVEHDHGDNTADAVTAISAGLHTVAAHLAQIDTGLNETHDHAAHLFRR